MAVMLLWLLVALVLRTADSQRDVGPVGGGAGGGGGGGGAGGITVDGLLEADGERRQYMCPARFIRMGNSCYFLSTLMASWHDAHFKCRQLGAQLAVFEKRWENRNMRQHLLREELAPLSRWIGGIYQWEKRFWMWGSTGLQIAYKAFPRRMVTQDWSWHCIAMDPSARYQWRPASCLQSKHYICETPLRRLRKKGPRRKPMTNQVADKQSRVASRHYHLDGGVIRDKEPWSRRPVFNTTASRRWESTARRPGASGMTVHRRPNGPYLRASHANRTTAAAPRDLQHYPGQRHSGHRHPGHGHPGPGHRRHPADKAYHQDVRNDIYPQAFREDRRQDTILVEHLHGITQDVRKGFHQDVHPGIRQETHQDIRQDILQDIPRKDMSWRQRQSEASVQVLVPNVPPVDNNDFSNVINSI